MAGTVGVLPKSEVSGGVFLKYSVFLCVGTHTQPFDRLLRKMDEIAIQKKNELKIFAQIGNSKYIPKKYEYKRFLNEGEFEKIVSQSDLVIAHAGAGIIISGLAKRKKLIVMPRLEKFGEHTDSHQIDIASAFAKKNKVLAVFDEKYLLAAIDASKNFNPIIENDTKKIVQELEAFVKKNG